MILSDRFGEIKSVAGIDVGYRSNGAITQAAIVTLNYPDLVQIETSTALTPTSFPYIPGLLSFRELPAILEAFHKLRTKPDLLLCDGHGYAHPRRFGLACHLGVTVEIPSIGVGKTRLIGEHRSLESKRGSWTPLVDEGEIIAAVLRTRENVKPIFVSIGHRISLESAIALVLNCAPKYRLPEPIRQAHALASA